MGAKLRNVKNRRKRSELLFSPDFYCFYLIRKTLNNLWLDFTVSQGNFTDNKTEDCPHSNQYNEDWATAGRLYF